MLTKLSLESARILAEELNRRKVAVQVLPETPLERLVEAGKPVTLTDEPKTIEESVNSLEVNTLVPEASGGNTHDALIDGLTDQVVTLMNRRLGLARTVINPIISEYANAIANYIGDKAPKSPEVNEIEFSTFHDAPVIRDVFTGYGFTDLAPVSGYTGIQFNDQNNYHRDAFKTGSSLIDNGIKGIIEKYGDDWYKGLARKYFTQGENITIAKPELTDDYARTIDENVILHMLARHFYNADAPLVNESQTEWDGKLLRILGRTSQNLSALWKYKEGLESRSIVLESVALSGHQLNVYGPTYRDYINKGGTNTALMGHARTKGRRLSINELLENHTSLESIYDKETAREIALIRSDKYRLMQGGALTHLPFVVDNIPDEVINTIPQLNSPERTAKELLLERGRDFINNPKGIDLNDIDGYAEDIILVGLLPELELHQFFRGMDKYLKPSNGGAVLTPKQAAYYVVLEEIVTFFMSQTSLSGK